MNTGPTVRRRRLGTELRRLRESNGFKLEEVAAQLGVAPSTLSRIETGKAPTKSAYLNQMLETYGVTDSEVSYVESVAGIIYLEKDRDVRLRAEAFDRLRAAALAPAASAEMIAQAAHELR